MELFEKIKKFESLHIVFWLIKDSCWMLEWRWMGILMVIPTITIAIIIVYISRKTIDVFLNLAILFWISANSFWMYCEFFNFGENKQDKFINNETLCFLSIRKLFKKRDWQS